MTVIFKTMLMGMMIIGGLSVRGCHTVQPPGPPGLPPPPPIPVPWCAGFTSWGIPSGFGMATAL